MKTQKLPTVYLKFNRPELASQLCLLQWIEIFKDYPKVIVCDLFNISKKEPIPDYLQWVTKNNIDIINTDYSLGERYTPGFKARKRNQSSANLTCFELGKNQSHYWLIDADDTMFLTRDYDFITNKLEEAEQIFLESNLDAFSLDFYREIHHDHWSFGVCLLKGNLEFEKILTVDLNEIEKYPGLTRNLDSLFDILRRKKIFNLKSFVINNMAFQHTISPFNSVPNGIYYWNDRKLWQDLLLPDVITL